MARIPREPSMRDAYFKGLAHGRVEGAARVQAVLLGVIALGEWAHARTRGVHVQCAMGVHFWDYGPPARCVRCGETDDCA